MRTELAQIVQMIKKHGEVSGSHGSQYNNDCLLGRCAV